MTKSFPLTDWVHGDREKKLFVAVQNGELFEGSLTEHEKQMVECFQTKDLRRLQRLQFQKIFDCEEKKPNN